MCKAGSRAFFGHHVQAAALLGQVAQRSQEHNDELAAALARVHKSLAAALLDAASETQYGGLIVKHCAFIATRPASTPADICLC